jgi:hypothetical protein
MRIRRLPTIPQEFAGRCSPDLQIWLAELAGAFADFKIMYGL